MAKFEGLSWAAEAAKQSGLQFDLDATEKLSVALLIARTRAY
jgi:hypothetical protein